MSLDGTTTLRDLSTQLRWSFPREAGVETLAGFLLLHLGHIPQVGESLELGGRRYTVAEMDGRRISRVRIETHPETPAIEPQAETKASGEANA
jgi:putative hemolysin